MTLKTVLQQLSANNDIHNADLHKTLLTSLKHSVKIGRDCEGNWTLEYRK